MSAWAAAAYVPIPFWQVVPVIAARHDRLVRYHAWQAAATVLLLWAALVLVGLLVAAVPALAAPVALAAGVLVVAGLGALVAGAVAGARGRYLRIPGAWHVLALLRR